MARYVHRLMPILLRDRQRGNCPFLESGAANHCLGLGATVHRHDTRGPWSPVLSEDRRKCLRPTDTAAHKKALQSLLCKELFMHPDR